MEIAGINLTDNVLIVAEIGNNHEGNFEVAAEMVRKASECGVDAVKFQTFQTKYFVSASDHARFERLSSFELSYREFEQLYELTKSLGLLFISTPLDIASADFLRPLVDCFKIASGDNDFYPLIERVCQSGKPIIISSGLSDLAQMAKSKQFVEDQWTLRGINQHLAVLHCVSSYPVPSDQANLAAIPFLARELGCTIGYSDHTVGLEACLIAVALGAQIVEKHFTLDKHYSDFRDHQLSADPAEMKQLVEQTARVRATMGKPEKKIQPIEADGVPLIRRSIVAAADLPQGHQLNSQDITWTRPVRGLRPGDEGQIIGRALKAPVSFGEPILISDLEER
jgi:N,N'-diacetyllegionaminate synthase